MRRPGLPLELATALCGLVVLWALPLLLPSPAFMDFVIRLSAMGLFATSLNLLVGYTGLVSFGHGLFFGLGAYAFALLMQRSGASIPEALLFSLALSGGVALIVGAICVRLRTIYFAFVTLAMQMLVHSVILSWQNLTGGDQGLRGGIPRRVVAGINLADQHTLYLVAAVVLIIGILLMRHVAETPLGYSARLVRDNEDRAAFLGISVFRVKLGMFVLAGMFAALGGVVMSLFVAGAYPELANWPLSGQAIFAIMLGGIGVYLGPLAGTAILLALNDLVTRQTQYYGLALGIIILAVALGLRRGVLEVVVTALRARRERASLAARARHAGPV
jgi:branched-chain amino acid transport system permease protein